MKVSQLFEGRLSKGHYDLGYRPTSRDRGLAHLYNNVIPALARIFKLPAANIKVHGDYGNGWSTLTAHQYKPYSTEKFMVKIILRRKGMDEDMIFKLFPKALKHELEKQLKGVEVSVLEQVAEKAYVAGSPFDGGQDREPAFMIVSVKTKWPDEWVKWDKERYGIQS